MPVKPVFRMGETSLLEPCNDVDEFSAPALEQLIIDMWDTMAANNGAGIAAPQIGVNLRVVIFGFEKNSRYPDAPVIPQTVLINPVITPLDGNIEAGWEGCLSVPGMRGLVPRHARIRYCGFDQFGNSIDREVEGFHARVVQHECDHLDGILYPQRIEDMFYFGYCEELEANNYMASWTRKT